MASSQTPAAKITSLDHLVLTVRSIPATKTWYENTLGMRSQSFVSGGVTRHSLNFGEQKINLHELGHEFEPKAAKVQSGSADLCFITRDPVSEVRERLLTQGVSMLELDEETEGGIVGRTGARGSLRSVYCRDPDGNLIE
ncbi:Glyoxalase domain-containing protein [Lachnellula suecica]|uniref:Glyoxalase domain-containing protein n=1 Tax=Lachnellula suecica TaxID=602035 RepID=A0A8T9BWF4_9HELO|nr:Glyoxalase domain-containing protein [Lachnellula suecica]